VRMSKAQREARASYIERRAFELARGGTHANWLSIENAIRLEGYEEARGELDRRWLRDELNEICRSAQEAND
jgi:hypothetical protein